MAHPQNSPRGLFVKNGINIGGQVISGNSTALTLAGGLFLSGKVVGKITANSTGALIANALYISAKTTGKISANSTAILIPATGFQMAALTTLKITSNSTGIKIGTKYISCNSTGNATT